MGGSLGSMSAWVGGCVHVGSSALVLGGGCGCVHGGGSSGFCGGGFGCCLVGHVGVGLVDYFFSVVSCGCDGGGGGGCGCDWF